MWGGGFHKLEHDLIGDVWLFSGDFFQNIPPWASHEAVIQSRQEKKKQ
jgi:hypothetical protein